MFFFLIQKENGQWGNPLNITASSPYKYNYCPFVSEDGSKVLFDAGHESFPSTATGESIWKLPHDSIILYIIATAYPDDNSPVTLPDGKIASLWIPGSWHQIKIMNADGSGGTILTDSSSLFTEVFDIGITSTPANPVRVMLTTAPVSLKIYPNPSDGNFTKAKYLLACKAG